MIERAKVILFDEAKESLFQERKKEERERLFRDFEESIKKKDLDLLVEQYLTQKEILQTNFEGEILTLYDFSETYIDFWIGGQTPTYSGSAPNETTRKDLILLFMNKIKDSLRAENRASVNNIVDFDKAKNIISLQF